MHPRLRSTLLALLPAAAFIVGVSTLASLTARQRVQELCKVVVDASCLPLYQRLQGYSVADVARYWGWMDATALTQERRFLQYDLAFPLLYGAAFLFTLLTLRKGVTLRIPGWMVPAAVYITAAADWTENITQLQQLARFVEHTPLSGSVLGVASAATRIKLYAFSFCVALTFIYWLGAMAGPRSSTQSTRHRIGA